MSNKKLMERAIQLSEVHMLKGHGGPFGSVVTRKGKIVAEGWNQVLSTNDPTAHAEVMAIRKASKKLKSFDLSDCEIYTSCEPCPMCLAAIYWARIKKIYFANSRKDAAKINFDDDAFYREIKKKISDRKIPMIQLSRNEAQQVFKKWQLLPQKQSY